MFRTALLIAILVFAVILPGCGVRGNPIPYVEAYPDDKPVKK